MTTPEPSKPGANVSEISFLRLITTGITTKLIADTGFQIFNPFLSFITAGIGVDLVTFGRLFTARNLVGLLAPLAGTFGDRLGYRRVIRLGMLILTVGLVLMGSSSSWYLALVAMLLLGFSHVCIIPILQAYVSAQLPYSKRGQAMGMIEYSWALAGIIGLSLMGVLIQWSNWRVPFFVLAALMAAMWVVFGFMPEVKSESVQRKFNLIDIFWVDENRRSTYAAIVAGALNYFAASQLMLIYGKWLTNDYGLNAISLGTVAFWLGVSDLLLGSVLVSLITDRIGKRVSVIAGSLISMVGYFAMPLLNSSVLPAVVGMALARGAFEFAIVANIALVSEQTPKQRGKALALAGALWQFMGAITGIVTPWLYERVQIEGIMLISGGFVVLAILVAVLLVREAGEV